MAAVATNLDGHTISDVEGLDATKSESTSAQHRTPTDDVAFKYHWRYWAIIIALSVVALLPAVEGTVVSTALPVIVHDLGGGKLYVWVVNSYFLTRCDHENGAHVLISPN